MKTRSTRAGPDHYNWKGGMTKHRGYWIHCSGPHKGKPAHVVVAEQALGRPLPPRAVVHHVDTNGDNNAPSNLVICESRAYHALLHKRMRALAACGDASALRCHRCKGYDRQDEMMLYVGQPAHRSCAAKFHRDRRYHAKRQGVQS